MALDADSMGSRIVKELQAVNLAAEDTAMLTKMVTAYSKGIIAELIENGVITSSNISVAGAGLVAPNGPVSGMATGTLTDGKIS